MVSMDFLNVERVEVLRGPQGTLYGRNSVGGTINIVTRQPTNALETSVRLTAGNYDKLRAEGAVSGPLVKNKVMGNFAFLRATRDGFVKDLDHPDHSLGSEDTWAGRGQLRVVFGTAQRVAPVGRLRSIRRGSAHVRQADRGEAGLQLRQPRQPVGGAHEPSGVREEHPAGRLGEADRPLNRTTTVTSLTAYRKSELRFFIDADATELSCRRPTCPKSSASSRRS